MWHFCFFIFWTLDFSKSFALDFTIDILRISSDIYGFYSYVTQCCWWGIHPRRWMSFNAGFDTISRVNVVVHRGPCCVCLWEYVWLYLCNCVLVCESEWASASRFGDAIHVRAVSGGGWESRHECAPNSRRDYERKQVSNHRGRSGVKQTHKINTVVILRNLWFCSKIPFVTPMTHYPTSFLDEGFSFCQ